MKNRSALIVVSSLFSLFSAAIAFSDESLYVQPFRAKIYSKPSIASEVLGQVESGFKFVSSGKEGSWVKLVVKGKQGYIPAVQVAATLPLGKSIASGADSAPKLGARARTASTAVVAGMKGLTYEDRARAAKDERSDFETLDRVDALRISQDELKSFQQGGGKR